MSDTNSLSSLEQANFEAVKQYINTGDTAALNAERKQMLSVCVKAYGILEQAPARGAAIRRLMSLMEELGSPMSYSTAARYIDFTRHTWGSYMGYSRDFVEAFFLNSLMAQIANPDASEGCRAKNLATLQRHLEHLPEQTVDPKLMERNTVNIQFNIGEQNFSISEEALWRLPTAAREALMQAVGGEIDEAQAEELLAGGQ